MTPKRRTAKEIAEIAGRSETWLRTHECSWCGQTLLEVFRGNCGAIYDRCDTEARLRDLRRRVDAANGEGE